MGEREFNQSSDADQRTEVFRALVESSHYRAYATDFNHALNLPVSLTPMESWQLAHHDQTCRSPFCALLAQHSSACAACLRTQQKLANMRAQTAQTIECIHGLCETAVPVRAGEKLVGFIRTGQVFRRPPSLKAFDRVVKRLTRWGVTLDPTKLREAYFSTRVMAPAQYSSAIGLLNFLAQHLSVMSNQILMRQAHAESPLITNAKQFIETNHAEKLRLRDVAGAVHVDPFHFCRKFKQGTGLKFTCYLARLRVDKAKNLMLNPHYRVSEIAYAVGFESLSHFNRMFKRVTGLSPTDYRVQIAGSLNANGKTSSHYGRWQLDLNKHGNGDARLAREPCSATSDR